MSIEEDPAFHRVEEGFAALDRACSDDAAMRAGGESLLAADSGTTFVRDAVSEEAQALAERGERAWIGRRLEPWRISGIVGRGGMGAVYEVLRDRGPFQEGPRVKIVRR